MWYQLYKQRHVELANLTLLTEISAVQSILTALNTF